MRIRNKKFIGVLLFLFTGTICYLYWLGYFHQISEPNAELTEKELIKDLYQLGNHELKIDTVQIFRNGISPDLTVEAPNGLIDNTKQIILTNIRHPDHEMKTPLEVKQSFRIWLHIHERILSIKVVSVTVECSARSGLSRAYVARITEEEFKKTYDSLNVNDLEFEEKVDLLSNTWIEKTNYSRDQ